MASQQSINNQNNFENFELQQSPYLNQCSIESSEVNCINSQRAIQYIKGQKEFKLFRYINILCGVYLFFTILLNGIYFNKLSQKVLYKVLSMISFTIQLIGILIYLKRVFEGIKKLYFYVGFTLISLLLEFIAIIFEIQDKNGDVLGVGIFSLILITIIQVGLIYLAYLDYKHLANENN